MFNRRFDRRRFVPYFKRRPFKERLSRERNQLDLNRVEIEVMRLVDNFEYYEIGGYLAGHIGKGKDKEILRTAIEREIIHHNAGLDRVLLELKKRGKERLIDEVFGEFQLDEIEHVELAYDYGLDREHWAKEGILLGIKYNKRIPTRFLEMFLSEESYRKVEMISTLKISVFYEGDFNKTIEHLEQFISRIGDEKEIREIFEKLPDLPIAQIENSIPIEHAREIIHNLIIYGGEGSRYILSTLVKNYDENINNWRDLILRPLEEYPHLKRVISKTFKKRKALQSKRKLRILETIYRLNNSEKDILEAYISRSDNPREELNDFIQLYLLVPSRKIFEMIEKYTLGEVRLNLIQSIIDVDDDVIKYYEDRELLKPILSWSSALIKYREYTSKAKELLIANAMGKYRELKYRDFPYRFWIDNIDKEILLREQDNLKEVLEVKWVELKRYLENKLKEYRVIENKDSTRDREQMYRALIKWERSKKSIEDDLEFEDYNHINEVLTNLRQSMSAIFSLINHREELIEINRKIEEMKYLISSNRNRNLVFRFTDDFETILKIGRNKHTISCLDYNDPRHYKIALLGTWMNPWIKVFTLEENGEVWARALTYLGEYQGELYLLVDQYHGAPTYIDILNEEIGRLRRDWINRGYIKEEILDINYNPAGEVRAPFYQDNGYFGYLGIVTPEEFYSAKAIEEAIKPILKEIRDLIIKPELWKE